MLCGLCAGEAVCWCWRGRVLAGGAAVSGWLVLPWFGGMWERLVASVKRCLKKVIGIKIISFVELKYLQKIMWILS